MPRDRKRIIEHHMNYCQHYDTSRRSPEGFLRIGCSKGHDHHKAREAARPFVPDKDGVVLQPCIKGHLLSVPATQVCPDWCRNTRESGEDLADKFAESERRFNLVMPVVAQWRAKPPRGKQEVIECPACKGKLHLSQAASNGHVWGKCETDGCVSWME